MKATLMITAAPAVLASILATLPADASVSSGPVGIPGHGDEEDDDGPANAAAPAVDVNGMPWDGRIHAGTKGTKADGSWKRRKGVTNEEVAAVEAELRASQAAAPLPPVAAPTPIAPPMPVPVPPMPTPEAVAAPVPVPVPVPPMPTPEPVAAPVAPVAAPIAAAPAPEGLDFAGFMQHLSAKMAQRDATGQPVVHADYLSRITAEISTAFAPHGVPALSAITDVATNPQLITYAVQLMQRDGKW